MNPTSTSQNDIRRPFPFFVGRGRSGTTLLRAMFDAHPDMAVPDESHFVVTLGHRRSEFEEQGGFNSELFVDHLFGRPAFKLWGLDRDEVLADFDRAKPVDYPAAIRALYGSYARHQGKSRYADKTPIYVLHIDFLSRLFPEAKFVHIIRDGRDVALSYLDVQWGPQSVEEAAIYWKRFVRSGRRAGAALGPSRYTEVHYERLLEDPEGVVRDLCAFLDVEFSDQMLRYFERADQVAGAMNNPDARKGLYLPPTKGLRDWRRDMSPRDRAVFGMLAGDLIDELDYERSQDSLSLRDRAVTRARQLDLEKERYLRSRKKRRPGGRPGHVADQAQGRA
jgi:hypothetical protein